MDVGRRSDARRRTLLGSGVDDPVAVVEVERRVVLQQLHLGTPVAVDGARRPASSPRSGSRRRARRPGIMAGMTWRRSRCGPPTASQERPLGEHVDAQAREIALRLARLLLPLDHLVVLVEPQDAEAVRFTDRDALHRDGHVRALAAVLLHERLVVHLVDVVAGQDDHGVRVGAARAARGSGAPRRQCRDTIPLPGCGRCTAACTRMPPSVRSRSQGRPAPMWSLSERGLYCVSTITSLMSELTQLLRVKSMIRYLPAKGTAGLARTPERMDRRSPRRRRGRWQWCASRARCYPIRPPSRTSRERGRDQSQLQAPRPHASDQVTRVDRRVPPVDLPVEVRAGRVPGVAHVADELTASHDPACPHQKRGSRWAYVVERPPL